MRLTIAMKLKTDAASGSRCATSMVTPVAFR
jgi:hypothetical protein